MGTKFPHRKFIVFLAQAHFLNGSAQHGADSFTTQNEYLKTE